MTAPDHLSWCLHCYWGWVWNSAPQCDNIKKWENLKRMRSGWPCSYEWASWGDPPSPKTGSANRVLINGFPFHLPLWPTCDDFSPRTMSSRCSPSILDAPAFRTFAYTYMTQHSNITWHECELWNCVSELKPRFHPIHIARLHYNRGCGLVDKVLVVQALAPELRCLVFM